MGKDDPMDIHEGRYLGPSPVNLGMLLLLMLMRRSGRWQPPDKQGEKQEYWQDL